jgi:hypothetical protein
MKRRGSSTTETRRRDNSSTGRQIGRGQQQAHNTERRQDIFMRSSIQRGNKCLQLIKVTQ